MKIKPISPIFFKPKDKIFSGDVSYCEEISGNNVKKMKLNQIYEMFEILIIFTMSE